MINVYKVNKITSIMMRGSLRWMEDLMRGNEAV